MTLEKFDAIRHLLGLVDLPYENESPNDLASAQSIFVAKSDTGMRHASRLEGQKIGVVRYDYPAFGASVRGLLFVLGSQKPDFGRQCDVDAASSKASGNGRVATLIQVKSYRSSHWPS
jgi:hypothetical protein